MMKLIFKDSRDNNFEVSEIKSDNEVLVEIKKFCGKRDYKIPYIRSWISDYKIYFDVGSTKNELFYLVLDE